MKKLLSIFLTLTLAVSITACSAKPAEIETTPENANIVSAYNPEAADYKLGIDAAQSVHGISDMLYGIFFEDINFAADGGLYAEMVANRSFEFTELAKDDQLYHWRTVGEASADVKIGDTENALNENNTNYLVLTNGTDELSGIENIGFLEGMAVKEGEKYNFSAYLKALDGYSGRAVVRLTADGKTVAEGEIPEITDKWEKYSLELNSDKTASEEVTLQVLIEKGSVAADMVSLFPENTFKNRGNGMRADLAQLLAELKPKFLRFPGGCVIEGFDVETAYSWKDSIGVGRDGLPLLFNGKYGDVAARKQGVDLWTDIKATDDEWPSFMSYGLGFFEFFQLSEDIGAVGVPVLNAGLYCQGRDGKAVDMSTPEFRAYVQDMLDLVEFCRGDESTTWGKVRVSLGHPEPFELKYICIGNENHSEVYYERYSAFLDALKKAKAEKPELYKDIELIYSSGGDDGFNGDAYLNSYKYAKQQLGESTNATDFAGAVDSHYYNDPSWFFENANYYDEDNYRRSVAEMTDTFYGGAIPVFLGEYASWSNNLESALSEAAYMTGLERNGDIVRMSCYAPLFSSVTARHWAPNLIWFNNGGAQPSANYYIQKLFSTNAGTQLVKSELDGAFIGNADLKGRAGVGTWKTSAEFDNIKVVDNRSGEVLYENDFSSSSDFKKNWEMPTKIKAKVKGGRLVLKASEEEREYGSVMFFGDGEWSNYTVTFDAKKTGGEEGFFIPIAVKDSDNVYFWNVGGWGNTRTALQEINRGKKTGELEGTVSDLVIEEGRTYKIKITVDGTHIMCYLDDELYADYDASTPAEAEAYQVVSRSDDGDLIIKLVNVTDTERTFAVKIDNLKGVSEVKAKQVSGNDLKDENVFSESESVSLKELKLDGITDSFNYTVPKYSATVIRITEG